MQYLRLLLFPFSLIYGSVVWLRNKAYDVGILRSIMFDLPVISIGNLTVGGAGKSPLAEYIVLLVKDEYKTAVLSRGYGRKTKGFRLVNATDGPGESGDEPLQFCRKFSDVTVAVSEQRVIGINNLKKNHQIIILDDAFQHRAVKPGLSVLVFDYNRLNDFLYVLPAGNLREPFSNRVRADILVVSKCPEHLAAAEQEFIRQRIRPHSHQRLFFSSLDYRKLTDIFTGEEKDLKEISRESTVFILTGIANPEPLLKKVKSIAENVIHHDYPDHHQFSSKNITKLAKEFREDSSKVKLVITTEKDAQRLKQPHLLELLKGLPVYYLPVVARFHQPGDVEFNDLIRIYVKGSTQYNSIH